MTKLTCFKSYDVRGVVPSELNSNVAYNIGRAFAAFLQPELVVIGHDIRLTGPEIASAITAGLLEMGVDVINIGQCGSEEIYFAVPHLEADGGICITASHNPAEYNGMKFVREQAKPISSDNGLLEIQKLAEKAQFQSAPIIGNFKSQNIRKEYAKKILSFTDIKKLKPLKIVANPGNGGAGGVIEALEPHVPYHFNKIHFEPDGHFPNGVPNPLLPENRESTRKAVLDSNADMGIAWDGDFDRCFFFDEKGNFIEGYYIVSLLTRIMLERSPREKIIYDPRLYWATQKTISQYGGQGIVSKTGHAFIKDAMRSSDAIYGGEMSAHHYFRDFYYCDNGHLPWLLIAELLSTTGKKLSELVSELIHEHPCSGEINLKAENSDFIFKELIQQYEAAAINIDTIDGLGMEFEQWRFNIRASNTEPLLRLNVESLTDRHLMNTKTDELLAFIQSLTSTITKVKL